ncbi:hypothetical protein MPSEU_000995600 [Mayamaea pseudoterrestris]|nr:hypothetical protein MPSEU_000995600 [Mayamaea pseudoterrestris]
MAGSKRMSADEKRKTILDIFHKTKSVYTEKEIITLATKSGVNTNTVADQLQSLIDDSFVEKSKIGGSNYFWSFPAKKDAMLQVEHSQNLEALEKVKEAVLDATAKLADAKRGREESEDGERAKKLARLKEIAAEKTTLTAELDKLKENDPQALADLQQELKLVTEAANRWTDNIFNARDYMVKKRGMDRKDANKMLGITGDFDYPEDKIPK